MTLIHVSMFQPGDRTKVTEWVCISSFERQIIFMGVPAWRERTMVTATNSTVPAGEPFTIRSRYRFWQLSQK